MASEMYAALTPRRSVSLPLVCTDQRASSAAPTSRALICSSLLSAHCGVLAAAMHKIVNAATGAVSVGVKMRMRAFYQLLRPTLRKFALRVGLYADTIRCLEL